MTAEAAERHRYDPGAMTSVQDAAAAAGSFDAQTFNDGVKLHRAMRLDEAEAIYRRVLAARPGHAGALHLLGVVDIQRGRPTEALEKIRRALEISPAVAAYHGNLGTALQALGRFDEAVVAYREAVRIDATYADAHNNLGALHEKCGRYADAIASYRAALAVRADFVEALSNLGQLLRRSGSYEEAATLFMRAIEHGARDGAVHRGLGMALGRLNRTDEAIVALRKAIEINPADHEAHNHLGNRLKQKGAMADAEACYREALRLKPDYVDAHNNIGNSHFRTGRLDEAEACYRKALALKPDYADGHGNLGIVHMGMGRHDASIASLREALRLRPVYPEASCNLSQALLVTGQFKEGWDRYEARWSLPSLPARPFRQPWWRGESLIGRTILLHAEQGVGDTFQFVRFAGLVRDLGADVLLEVPRETMCVLAPLAGPGIRVIPRGSKLPHFDLHCPLLSIPGALGCDLETIPAEVPYLAAEPKRVEAWRDRIGRGGPLKVGLVWAGNPQHANDHHRSFRPVAYRPLWEIPGVAFFSLQKQQREGDAADLATLGPITDLAPHLGDFADTAAALCALDLLISVDTSVVHLAGALGRPVWTMVPFSPDWRWLVDRPDTPWYPTMRLFRQTKRNDWKGTVSRVADALMRLRG